MLAPWFDQHQRDNEETIQILLRATFPRQHPNLNGPQNHETIQIRVLDGHKFFCG